MARSIGKVRILPLIFMTRHNLNRGQGLLADRNYVYVIFIEKQRIPLHRFEWAYCHCFNLEQLSDRCLLFVVLRQWLLRCFPDNDSRREDLNKLDELATKCKNDKTSEDKDHKNET